MSTEFHDRFLSLEPNSYCEDAFVKIWAREVANCYFEMGGDPLESEWRRILLHAGYLHVYKTNIPWEAWEAGVGGRALNASLALGREIGASINMDPTRAADCRCDLAGTPSNNTLLNNLNHRIGLRVARWFHDFEGAKMPDPATHDSELLEAMRLWGYTAIIASRNDPTNCSKTKMPLPVVFANWRMNAIDMPGYFAEYGRYSGFNKGLCTYYFENTLPPDKNPVTFGLARLASTIAQAEREGAGRWQAAWISNSWQPPDPATPLIRPAEPGEYQALVTLLALAGVNDLVFFPQGAFNIDPCECKNGGPLPSPEGYSKKAHFGPLDTPATSAQFLAQTNAEVYYNACVAAKRFQPFAGTLADSKVHLCLTDGSAEAAGNTVRFEQTTGDGNLRIDLPMDAVVTKLNCLGVGEHTLQLSADIKCLEPGGVSWLTKALQTNTPWIRALYLWVGERVIECRTWFDTAAQKAGANDVFVRRRSNKIVLKVLPETVSRGQLVDYAFVRGTITGAALKWEFHPGPDADQVVEFDNIKLVEIAVDADNLSTEIGPPLVEWKFDTPATQLFVTGVANEDVVISDGEVSGLALAPNGIDGLSKDSVFLSRIHEPTKEYWFAGMKTSGSQEALVRLPHLAGYVTNMVTREYRNIGDGRFELMIDRTAALHYFGPRVPAPLRLLSGVTVPVWPEEAVTVLPLRTYTIHCRYTFVGTPASGTHLEMTLAWYDVANNLLRIPDRFELHPIVNHPIALFPNVTSPFQGVVTSPIGAARLEVQLKAVSGTFDIKALHVKNLSREEKLINRDFEVGSESLIPGWVMETLVAEEDDHAVAELDSANYRSGSRSVKLAVTENRFGTSYANLRTDFTDQAGNALRLEEETDYELIYWVRGANVGVNSRIELYSRTSPNWTMTKEALVLLTNLQQDFGWTRVRHPFNSGSATFAVIHLQLRHVTGTIWIDDVSLRKQSLIRNGDFEYLTGGLPHHWSVSPTDGNSFVTVDRSDGVSSMKLVVINPSGTAWIASNGPEAVMACVEPDTNYEFSFDVRGSAVDVTGEHINVRFGLTNSEDNRQWGAGEGQIQSVVTQFPVSAFVHQNGTFDWTRKTIPFRTTATQRYFFVYLQLRLTKGTIWVTGVRLTKV